MAKNILIVEDDRFLRELISQKLAQEDFNVSEAIDGEEGIKKIKEEKPDLVLLDLILPGIDGFEVLSRAKQEPDEKINKIPIIILSNLGQKEDIEKGSKLGATDYLVKAHFTPGEIIEKVRTILN
jgi:DNA-binding response OmpR family regulator